MYMEVEVEVGVGGGWGRGGGRREIKNKTGWMNSWQMYTYIHIYTLTYQHSLVISQQARVVYMPRWLMHFLLSMQLHLDLLLSVTDNGRHPSICMGVCV